MVVQHGSFAAAGQAAGVSQAAISQAMGTLEQELGFALFMREGRRKLTTPRALAVARESESFNAVVQRLSAPHAVRRKAGGGPVTVRVGLAPAAGLLYGPVIYNTIHAAGNGQTLRVVTGPAPDMLVQLQQGQLDLVIAPQPRKFRLGALQRHVMYVGDPVVYARAGHPLVLVRTLAEIARVDWVVAGASGTPGNVIEEAFRVRRWPPPRIAAQCTDYTMMLRLVAGSDLMGVISHPSLVPEAARAQVRPLQIVDGLPRYDVCLFWSGARRIAHGDALVRVVEVLTGPSP